MGGASPHEPILTRLDGGLAPPNLRGQQAGAPRFAGAKEILFPSQPAFPILSA